VGGVVHVFDPRRARAEHMNVLSFQRLDIYKLAKS